MSKRHEADSVGEHWSHRKFAENMVNASRASELPKAANEWHLHKLYVSREGQNCQLCNKKINRCVVLKNAENGNFLVLGEDCYDKFLRYLATERVESRLSTSTDASDELKRRWKGLLKELKDNTVVGWLKDELAANRLPERIAEVVHSIAGFGFAPTAEDADAVIAYYKATRKFKGEALLSADDCLQLRRIGTLPAELTIDEIGHYKSLAEKERVREAGESARKDVKRSFDDILSEIEWLRTELDASSKKGNIAAVGGLELLDVCKQEIEKMANSLSAAPREMYSEVATARRLWLQCRHVCEWRVSDPEKVLFVALKDGTSYILAKRDRKWQRLHGAQIQFEKGVPEETGVYEARSSGKSGAGVVYIERKLDEPRMLMTLDFSVKSTSGPGFIARLGGKPVLPARATPVRKPGKRIAFILSEEQRFILAWVIEE